MKKYLLISAGFASLSLGVLGIFLPVLPTTPFLLLSAAFFLKSSKSLYNRLTGHKILGGYIKNYLKYRAVTLKSKIISIITLWAVIGMTVIFFTSNLWLRIALIIIAMSVTAHLIKLKTLTKEMIDKDKADN